jgi:VIT1/CCC1 family predicted Fe2+/Mn2+ transporter
MTTSSAFDLYAYNEYRDYVTYRELARIETVPEFKRILDKLIDQELQDYTYWRERASRTDFSVAPWELWLLRFMRRILGLTFTAKFLELGERRAVRDYTELLKVVQGPERERVQSIIAHEKEHERALINQIKEEKVEFIGSVILGLNDALVELTGALVGFSFVFTSRWLVVATGFMTATAASLSMAASAYMQARHEEGKDPWKAALYTGCSYWGVAFALILPFAVIPSTLGAIGGLFMMVLAIVYGISYYTSVLFERPLKRQFVEMLVASLGVGAIASLLGSLLKHWTGVSV